MIIEKACTKCKEVKAVSEFGKQLNAKCGLRSACKLCLDLYNKKYRLEHIDEQKLRYKNYRNNNLEKTKEACHKWKSDNLEKFKEDQRKYALNNPERMLKQSRVRILELRDHYVKKCLCQNIPKDAITPELIETKRMQIKLLRLIKELR